MFFFFDINSPFTNIPLMETIDTYAHLLYHPQLEHLPIPESVFVELMNLATRDVEFSFTNIMFVQIDGVAMGSPLGKMLANIFVGYQELEKLTKLQVSQSPSLSTTPSPPSCRSTPSYIVANLEAMSTLHSGPIAQLFR